MSTEATRTRRRSLSDPISAALRPPPNESPTDRERRLKAEADAKKINDDIDEIIKAEKNSKKKEKAIKVLLLGQSESGKSTTLKQFQLLHTPAAFHAERIAWRFVIYLNLVRSVRRILEAISPEVYTPNTHTILEIDEEDDMSETVSMVIAPIENQDTPPFPGIPDYENYHTGLAPLVTLERLLIAQLSDEKDNESREATRLGVPDGYSLPQAPKSSTSMLSSNDKLEHGDRILNGLPGPVLFIPPTDCDKSSNGALASTSSNEPAVRTTSNWKKALSWSGRTGSPKSPFFGEGEGWWEDPNDPVHVLNNLAPAMLNLWQDSVVKQRLADKNMNLEESSGFFLDEIPRITAKMYIPTDVDVLKARLKTTGVIEHTFTIKNNEFRGMNWKIYDVGGARNQRQSWAPYFDDVNAIIFLAPISTFDQVLAEDDRVNRLEDSLLLWKSVVSNQLLAHVNIIIFLNKCDLLQAKLDTGVRLNQYLISYGDRPNDYDSVSKYFRNKFGALHQSYTPNRQRELYIHLTAVTDTRRTQTIIGSVRDSIIRNNLRSGGYM